MCVSLLLAILLSRYYIGNLGIREFVDPYFYRTYAIKGVKGMLDFAEDCWEGHIPQDRAQMQEYSTRRFHVSIFRTDSIIDQASVGAAIPLGCCGWGNVHCIAILLVAIMTGAEIRLYSVLSREAKKPEESAAESKA